MYHFVWCIHGLLFQTNSLPTSVPTKGEREFHKDTVKGIWVRITRRGEVIAEYQSNEAAMGSLSWDNESHDEIKFRRTFGDEDLESELD